MSSTKTVFIAPKELMAFMKAADSKEKVDIDLRELPEDTTRYFLSRTKKIGAYFVHSKPNPDAVLIIELQENPSSVQYPKLYRVNYIDVSGTIATVYDPMKIKLGEHITALELYYLYGVLSGKFAKKFKFKTIRR